MNRVTVICWSCRTTLDCPRAIPFVYETERDDDGAEYKGRYRRVKGVLCQQCASDVINYLLRHMVTDEDRASFEQDWLPLARKVE